MSGQSRSALTRPSGDLRASNAASIPNSSGPVAGLRDDSHPGANPLQISRRSRLDELYRRHARWLRDTLRRRFGREDAEDLSQEAFCRATPYLDRDLASPRPLLLRIAANAAFERRTRDTRHAPDAGNGAGLWSEDGGLSGGQFDQVLLKQVIAELSPKLRDVFILSRFEGLTYPEIAQRCGISIKTVEWRMTKALGICAARLRD